MCVYASVSYPASNPSSFFEPAVSCRFFPEFRMCHLQGVIGVNTVTFGNVSSVVGQTLFTCLWFQTSILSGVDGQCLTLVSFSKTCVSDGERKIWVNRYVGKSAPALQAHPTPTKVGCRLGAGCTHFLLSFLSMNLFPWKDHSGP